MKNNAPNNYGCDLISVETFFKGTGWSAEKSWRKDERREGEFLVFFFYCLGREGSEVLSHAPVYLQICECSQDT